MLIYTLKPAHVEKDLLCWDNRALLFPYRVHVLPGNLKPQHLLQDYVNTPP